MKAILLSLVLFYKVHKVVPSASQKVLSVVLAASQKVLSVMLEASCKVLSVALAVLLSSPDRPNRPDRPDSGMSKLMHVPGSRCECLDWTTKCILLEQGSAY